MLLGLVAACGGIGFAAPPIMFGDLGADLGLGEGQTGAVTSIYALGLAVSSPLFGRLVDALGVRRSFDLAVVLVVVGGALAATAGGLPQLLAGRLVQGAAGGGLAVAAFATIPALVAADRTAVAQGMLTATALTCVGFGPLIGAGLGDVGGWRLTLCVPLAVLVLMPLVRPLMPTRTGAGTPLDGAGAVLVVVAAGAATLAVQGRALGLDLVAVAVAVTVALATAIALVRHVRARPTGFVPLSFMVDRRALTVSAVAAACFGSYLVLTQFSPAELEASEGWGPVTVGAVLLPAALAAVVGAVATGRRIAAQGLFTALTVLCGIAVAGLAIAVAVPSPVGPLLAPIVTIAAFAGGQVGVIECLPRMVGDEDRGAALGIGNLLFLSGGTFATALAASLAEPLGWPATLAILALAPLLAGIAAARCGEATAERSPAA